MRLLLRLVPFVFLLAGCATAPKAPSAGQSVPLTPTLTEEAAAPAYEALARGEFAIAAQMFQSLAARSPAPKKQEYALGAVEALISGGQLAEAGQLLAFLDPKGISARDRARARLLEARLALKKRDGDTALTALANPLAGGVEPAFHSEYHLLRGVAFTQKGSHLEAAREYALRDHYLTDPSMQLLNQEAIMEALSKVSETVLLSLKTAPAPDVFTGWLELARMSKSRQTLAALENQIRGWRIKYASHPARPEIVDAMRQRAQQLAQAPSRIALLLPFTGGLSEAAAAVRDGVFSAYYSSPDRGSVQLRTYDTGPEPANALAAYDQAVLDGAQFVIGPLRKEEVEALAQRGSLSIPVLALNTIEGDDMPPELFQFGLSPEEEARRVAERAWADGHTHAAMITPEGPWGARIAQSFRDEWVRLGGMVVAATTYESKENDYSAALRTMLKLNDSGRRQTEVERLLGRNLEFVPRRRQDLEFIFIAAYPKQARLLRPQIRFHHADDVPVYATSHVFTGTIMPEADEDMDGTIFGDMPWVIEEMHPAALSRYDGSLRRLVALGADSFNVLRYLRLLDAYPEEYYEGGTGVLRLDEKRRVQRQLEWARFEAGRPQPLELESLAPARDDKARE